jgi:hypothetical protein
MFRRRGREREVDRRWRWCWCLADFLTGARRDRGGFECGAHIMAQGRVGEDREALTRVCRLLDRHVACIDGGRVGIGLSRYVDCVRGRRLRA